MSRSTNRCFTTFGGCDYPRTKQIYVSFSNKKVRRYLKSNKDLDCSYFNKSFYKKFGGVDWEYRGMRKGSKLKKFKEYRLNLFRDEGGELNTSYLHKPIKYNCVVNVKDVSKYTKNDIVKIYPVPYKNFYRFTYRYLRRTTAHECFKSNQQRLHKYFIRKR